MDLPPDTAPIRPEERFDEERLTTYLREHVPEIAAASRVSYRQFPGGYANLTYLVRADDREFVLRRPPLGPTAPRSHDMVREHTVLTALNEAFPKAPRTYHLCTDPSVLGKPFFLMERRRGIVVRKEWPAVYPDDPGLRGRISESVVGTLVELHRIDHRAVGLEGFGLPEGFVARQVRGWTERWELARTRELPEMDELARVLAEAVPPPQAAVILHNDYKLDNLMLDRDGRVVAVFDWDMATIGDPLVDLGTALAYWQEPDDPPERRFLESPLTRPGFWPRAELAARYAEGTGFDLSRLAFYEALALFRIAVIAEQIYVRYRRGQTGDERFAQFDEWVPLTVQAALRAAARLG